MITEPSAPVARSSHRKSKRSWPGVPNRYRISELSSVIRPKSNATVVVVFWVSSDASSMPTERSVIDASVVSGSISEIAPMKVVLPTANPPLMKILTAEGPVDSRSERPYKVPDPLDHVHWQLVGLVQRDVLPGVEIRDENPRHPEGDTDPGRHLGHGHRVLGQF